MTSMREKLVGILDDYIDENFRSEEVLDAILSELEKPDEWMIDAAMREFSDAERAFYPEAMRSAITAAIRSIRAQKGE